MTPSLHPDELATYLALLEASNLLQQAVSQQLRQDGNLTQAQFEILNRLLESPHGLRMTELAAHLVISRSGLTYQVSQLEQASLLERLAHPDDERGVVARITPKGAALISQLLPDHIALVRANFLDLVDAQDLRRMREAFERVSAHLRI